MNTQLKNVAHPFVAPGYVGTTVRLSGRYAYVTEGAKYDLWECGTPHEGNCPHRGCTYHVIIYEVVP